MNVWVVLFTDYRGEGIEAVYDNEEAAEAHYATNPVSLYVEDHEVLSSRPDVSAPRQGRRD